MLDHIKLGTLKQAAAREDWIMAADIWLELTLESVGSPDESSAHELTLAVRLKDSERLPLPIDEMMS